MTKSQELLAYGQSIWLDYIRRQFIEDGGLQGVIDNGVRGVTSNPAIFEKAIAGSDDYDAQLNDMIASGDPSTAEIYEALAVEDIKNAADILRPVYDESDGLDGYVSLEVSPTLARDTQGTISEARKLWDAVNRPNLMIKVPATEEGIPAIETLISDGINVNVTLIFAIDRYRKVMEAYISGLERRHANGKAVSGIASVASFFISRVDVMVDALLEEKGNTSLQGKIGVANAKLAYAAFEEDFGTERWQKLADAGAAVQRPLWASTSTKNPDYPDTLYVDTLIGKHTVNTLPPDTFDAFNDHGTLAETVNQGVDESRAQMAQLADLGIDIDDVTQKLEDEGVEKFEKPFASLMQSIQAKREKLSVEGA